MAMSGTISKLFCSSKAQISAEWTAINENKLNGTRALSVKIYLDTYNAGSFYAAMPAYTNKSYVTINNKDYYFSTPAISKGFKGKVLIGTITTDNLLLTRNAESFNLGLSVYLNKIQLYASTTASNWVTSAETVTFYEAITLDGIDTRATIGITNGTLGTSQNITLNGQNSGFGYEITYVCGTASGTIYDGGETASAIAWKPPLSLASQNTTGTTVTATVTVTTTNVAWTTVGSYSYNITLSFPASVKPGVSLTVTDGEGHLETYGKYIQNVSTFDIKAVFTKSYNAEITAQSITANGATYTNDEVVTSVIKSAGSQTIKASATDTRKRTGTAEVTVDVYEYMFPIISALKVKRCDFDGTENGQGEYIQVTFNADITSLDGQNSANYALQYKKSTDTSYETVEFEDIAGQYSVANKTHIFEADTGSAYDILITATDDFTTTNRNTSGSTALVIMHFKASGRGMGIGKISELDDVVDMGFKARFFSGLLLKEPGEGANYNDLKTPNIYFCSKNDIDSYGNCPVDCDHILTVIGNADGSRTIQQIQTIEDVPLILTRCQTQNGWGSWI